MQVSQNGLGQCRAALWAGAVRNGSIGVESVTTRGQVRLLAGVDDTGPLESHLVRLGIAR